MDKQLVTEEYTHFVKLEAVSIDELSSGDLVYLKIKSPYNYGIHFFEYYGRIEKITDKFFWFLEYCDGNRHIKDMRSSQIAKRENNPKYVQKAKKSILELRRINTIAKKETREIYNYR